MQSMHVDAYDKAAAKAAEQAVRSLTVLVVLLIAVASVTALLLRAMAWGDLAGRRWALFSCLPA